MISHWTKFEGRPYGAEQNAVRVTLGPKKAIMLNEKAYEALGSPAAVEFMFEENHKIIGLKPIDPRKDNAFPIKPKKGSRHHVIRAAAFCTHVGIKVDRTVLFNDIDIDNEGVMKLEFAKTTNISRGAR
jgi:hypothetical protein